MNREVKNDKDDADPRSRVDKALGGLFIQVKKNMDKFAEISRSTTNVNSKAAKDLLFKTLDPKSSQAQTIIGEVTTTNKSNTVPSKTDTATTKLPPIQRRGTIKKELAPPQMRSTGNKSAFGAKSIDLLKSL